MAEHSESSEDRAAKFWLAEYTTLTADIETRVTLQHGLLNLHLIVVSAILGLLAAYAKDQSAILLRPDVRFGLLVVPLIQCFFLLRHHNHDAYIIDKAAYIHRILRPKVATLCAAPDILGFERYLSGCRDRRNSEFSLFVWFGGEYVFHVFLYSLVLVVAYVSILGMSDGKEQIIISMRARLCFALQDMLLIFDTLICLAACWAGHKIGMAYRSIVPKDDSERTVSDVLRELHPLLAAAESLSEACSVEPPDISKRKEPALMRTLDYASRIVSILSGVAVVTFLVLVWIGMTTVGNVQISTLLTVFSFTLVGGIISIGGVKMFSINANLRKTRETIRQIGKDGCPFLPLFIGGSMELRRPGNPHYCMRCPLAIDIDSDHEGGLIHVCRAYLSLHHQWKELPGADRVLNSHLSKAQCE